MRDIKAGKKLIYLILILTITSITSLPYCDCIDNKDDYMSSHVYTFAQSNSFIRLPVDVWNIETRREVCFQFRTDRPHGLLMYHTVVNLTLNYPIYELYVLLENARLKIIYEYNSEYRQIYVGKGLNRDRFHSVKLNIDPINGMIGVHLDNDIKKTLNISQNAIFSQLINQTQMESFLYFGGTDPNKTTLNKQYNTKRFIGCLGKIKFRTFQTFNELDKQTKAVILKEYAGIEKNCINLCKQLDLCAHNSLCINHYTYKSCDCFGTNFEDWLCRSDNITTITLRGHSYISYKIYNYKNKVHSNVNRISMHFKTSMRDGILLYAKGEETVYSHIAVNMRDGILYFEMDVGDGPVSTSFQQIILSDDKWHNLTIIHYVTDVNVIVDRITNNLELPGPNYHLHIDPDIYIGGMPMTRFKSNLEKLKISFNINQKFIGCLKSIYFNQINMLYELHGNNKAATYHSVFPAEYGCAKEYAIPVTLPTKTSQFIVNITSSPVLNLSLEFKSVESSAMIASGFAFNKYNQTFAWFLYVNNSLAKFSINYQNSTTNSLLRISNNLKYLVNTWQHIAIEFDNESKVTIISNYKYRNVYSLSEFAFGLTFYGNVSIGSTVSPNSIEGLRGCLRDIKLYQIQIDPRIIFSEYLIIGKITLDDCKLVDPCNSPKACEHNGRCIALLDTGNIECDCNNTGYSGKTCHFSKFKRTCEELYLAGFRREGVYMIDIDRNGPFPPSFVTCRMSEEDGTIQTIVEHNIRHQMIVREKGREGNFCINVTYRDFTPEMLHHLISHSKECSQYIKYECNLAPLRLGSNTWMKSAFPGHKVTSIENDNSGQCKCSLTQNCFDNTKYCNCDSNAIGWRHDDGSLTNPRDVGITKMFFLQSKNLTRDSEAHLTLGNVICTDSNTREYDITFKTKESYLEVVGWEGGDMAVSFKTTATKAVLFLQAALHSHHGYFKAFLYSEYDINFEFSVNGKPRVVTLRSNRRLNTGEWQQIWVESDAHHMKFSVNYNSLLIDLEYGDEVSAFEGPLYVGGAPRHLLENSEVRTGFIGCLRGLVLNNKVVNLHKYLHRKSVNIEIGCQPFCRPDICQNGGTCVELWGSYECKCANPIAQSGRQCEVNINAIGMTFITRSSYFQKLREGVEAQEVNPILEKDILMSFRTQMSDALILYANDYLNNFVQLHIENGTYVVFTYNSFDHIVRGIVDVGHILISGSPIQVKIDRTQRRKTILTANEASIMINHEIKFLTRYSQKPWKAGEELELVKPARPPVPTEAHHQLFLGGVDGISATSRIEGIVGCLKGFVIDNKQFDLEAAANEPETKARGHIKPGCTMLCDQYPCLNGGICIEDWKNKNYYCNCSMTSYSGNTCAKEVGAVFNGNSLVRYTFEDENEINLGIDYIHIQLAFSTNKQKNFVFKTILFVTYAQNSAYLLFGLLPDGSIVVEDVDEVLNLRRKVITSDELSFADKHRHWISYTRNRQNAQIIVDSQIYELLTISKLLKSRIESPNNHINVFVGGIENKKGDYNNFDNYSDFTGCISNVLVQLNDIKIEPLESAFGGKSDLRQVKVIGDIRQGLCASFQNHGVFIVEPPDFDNPFNDKNVQWITPPIPMLTPCKSNILKSTSNRGINRFAVFVICLTFLLIVLSSVGIYMLKLQKTYNIRRFQGDTPFFNKKRKSSRNKERINMIRKTSDYNYIESAA